MNFQKLFFSHLAPTSLTPLAIHIVKAKGIYLYDYQQKKYLDAISGINVSYLGHCNASVIKMVHKQLKKFSHLMVYGELIQTPAIEYAELLCKHLSPNLNNVYFTNSGSEAVEAAMKLAKRYTKRHKIIAFNKSYHGSTQGALSLLGDEYWRNAYRPLLPQILHYNYNDFEVLDGIDNNTACVIMEPIQAEAGIIEPQKKWLQELSKKCKYNNVLLVFDEIQTGFYRTGKLWAYQHFEIIPDILLLGKALGGGLPLGALICKKEIMQAFASQPVLGHITTFGGNAIACQAGLASFKFALENKIFEGVDEKIKCLNTHLQQLQSPIIKGINHKGLWASIQLNSIEECLKIVQLCIQQGLFIDWFLFASDSLRIAPPLTITKPEIKKLFTLLQKCLSNMTV